jgi:hypothetical protein
MFAAHISGSRTSYALEKKIVNKNGPIFSGSNSQQVKKLNQLSELQQEPVKDSPERLIKTTLTQKQDLPTPNIFAPQTSFYDHRTPSSEGDHLLKRYAQEFSPVKEFDKITIENIILTKGLPEYGPAATALIETLQKIQENPNLINDNYTEIFFNIYEHLAFNPSFHSDFYEMREALSRMNYKEDEIEEFEEGVFQKESIKY